MGIRQLQRRTTASHCCPHYSQEVLHRVDQTTLPWSLRIDEEAVPPLSPGQERMYPVPARNPARDAWRTLGLHTARELRHTVRKRLNRPEDRLPRPMNGPLLRTRMLMAQDRRTQHRTWRDTLEVPAVVPTHLLPPPRDPSPQHAASRRRHARTRLRKLCTDSLARGAAERARGALEALQQPE